MKKDKIIILMGLPASGKTTFAMNKSLTCFSEFTRLDFDEQVQKHKKYHKNDSKEQFLKQLIRNYFGEFSRTNYIIDGLFLKNEDIIKFLKILQDTSSKVNNVEINYWEPNIEACLWNDKFRREQNSTITIKNAVFEKPDKNLIEKETGMNIKIIQHQVVRKPLYKLYCDKNNINLKDNMYIRSDTWSLGGTWGSCWGNKGTCSADSPLTSFKEFDDLIEKICPDINFMKYKKLYNNCVSSDSYNEGDYYGGSVEYAYFQCDMVLLFNQLLEMNLINEEDILKE